ncbi:hypothetical protein P5V15_015090 [Pogonomyrmex californicus]
MFYYRNAIQEIETYFYLHTFETKVPKSFIKILSDAHVNNVLLCIFFDISSKTFEYHLTNPRCETNTYAARSLNVRKRKYKKYVSYFCLYFNIFEILYIYNSKDLHLIIGVLGDGCAVLVRAIDPLEGMEHMADQRNILKTRKVDLKQHELCNGPSKLCMAYQINKQHSRYSVCTWKSLWIEDDNVSNAIKIVKSTRIGIDSCGLEWANKPLRYYVYGNKSVSKRDKKAEAEIF